MSSAELVLAVANLAQTVALAWILAWQQRAAHEVRKLNGDVAESLRALALEVRPPDAPRQQPV